ncbi:methylpurine-DNA glycosylase (MPG) domain-containing protein [Ditylenchus destructor]|uniref:DNA-3-methyladenine glycosylase II n=1 Tax=Ditylenchus destructor TaxID=166010 RepID=A0AAD4NB08_9BILA|nr:methylpurine-DNA glycosylase (MPG) domain-containing protein [Ditylenchus destructor]
MDLPNTLSDSLQAPSIVPSDWIKLPSSFYLKSDVVSLTREFLGKIIVTTFDGHITAARIVEAEAYDGVTDRACHAYNGRRTARTQVMYCEGGTAYVYLCYGMHTLFNVVTNERDIPQAVLIRAAEPLLGIERMLIRTGKISVDDRTLTKGPANVCKALGIRSITGSRPLELRYLPGNPYESAVTADKKDLRDVVSGKLHLIVKVRRKKSGLNKKCEVQCLGTVSTILTLRNMCDFHYLPVRKIQNDNIYEDLVPRLIPSNFTSALSCIIGEPVYVRQDGAGPGKNIRIERKAFTVNCHGHDDFPVAPTEEAVRETELRVRNQGAHKMLDEIFNERPMWTRVAINSKSKLEDHVLKVLLAKFAFYIVSGPWGRLWCKFGYDPRKDPAARQYQTIMVTLRQHQNIPERQRLKVSAAEKTSSSSLKDQLIEYDYRPGVLPPIRQMWYCVCDVHLPVAQKVIREDFFNVLKKADPTYGWISSDIITAIRVAIKEDITKISSMLEVDEGWAYDADQAIGPSDTVPFPNDEDMDEKVSDSQFMSDPDWEQ